jgi:hypothetical protein
MGARRDSDAGLTGAWERRCRGVALTLTLFGFFLNILELE